jgi:DNA processing protein
MAIDGIGGLKWNEKLALLEKAADLRAFRALSSADIEFICGRRLRRLPEKPAELAEKAAGAAAAAAARNIRLVGYHDPAYPPQLREIFDPPFLLFCRGVLPLWDFTALAIVGTRYPSGGGRKAAWGLAREAAENGIVVVSGLARGVDGEAHRGCLEAGGRTIAVLGNGADGIFPPSHKGLASRILDSGGLIMSEYPPGAGVRKYFFPARNRIISGLSRAVLVAEAPAKSGALITADYALQQGRDLYVHEKGTFGASGEGCRALAASGAIVVGGMTAILSDWGFCGREADPASRPSRAEAGRIRENRAPGKTLALFLEEELAGSMSRHEGNYFRRNKDG